MLLWGSVGAITIIVNVNELLNKLGIIQEIVNKSTQMFVEHVKKYGTIRDEEVFKAGQRGFCNNFLA